MSSILFLLLQSHRTSCERLHNFQNLQDESKMEDSSERQSELFDENYLGLNLPVKVYRKNSLQGRLKIHLFSLQKYGVKPLCFEN